MDKAWLKYHMTDGGKFSEQDTNEVLEALPFFEGYAGSEILDLGRLFVEYLKMQERIKRLQDVVVELRNIGLYWASKEESNSHEIKESPIEPTLEDVPELEGWYLNQIRSEAWRNTTPSHIASSPPKSVLRMDGFEGEVNMDVRKTWIEEPDYDALVREMKIEDLNHFYIGVRAQRILRRYKSGTLGSFLEAHDTIPRLLTIPDLGYYTILQIIEELYGIEVPRVYPKTYQSAGFKCWNRPFTKADYERLKG